MDIRKLAEELRSEASQNGDYHIVDAIDAALATEDDCTLADIVFSFEYSYDN